MFETSSVIPTVNPCFGSGSLQLIEYGLCHRRVEILGGEAVAAADDGRHRGELPCRGGSGRRSRARRHKAARPARRTSLVRSSTATALAVFGMAARNASPSHGRYRPT